MYEGRTLSAASGETRSRGHHNVKASKRLAKAIIITIGAVRQIERLVYEIRKCMIKGGSTRYIQEST